MIDSTVKKEFRGSNVAPAPVQDLFWFVLWHEKFGGTQKVLSWEIAEEETKK